VELVFVDFLSLAELFDILNWISTWRQDVVDGDGRTGVQESLFENSDCVELVIALNESLLTIGQRLRDELIQRCGHAIWAQGSDHKQLLEVVTLKTSVVTW